MSSEYGALDVNVNLPKRAVSNTIELPLFLNMVAISLSGAALGNIILYRSCVHALNFPEEECRPFLSPVKNNETNHLEADVQRYATFVSTVKMVLEAVVPAFISFFLGAWSDTYGRKPLMVWSLLGSAITSMLLVVFGLMDSLGPWWYIATVIPFSMTGGYVVLFTGAYCYVSDTSTKENTSLRMTMVDATASSGSVIGSILSSYLILSIGNVYLLLLTSTLNVFSYAFTNVYIKESLNGALQGGSWRVLDLLLVKDMFRECFKRRPDNKRTQIILISITKFLLVIVLYGTSSLEYLFTRTQLHWSLQDFTKYSALSTSLSFVGGFFGIMVVQKILGIGDICFAIFAILSTIAEYVLKICAISWWYMYLGALISVFKGLSSALTRSYISKILPSEDVAKIFALVCGFEGFAPLLAPLIYNSLYAATLTTLPGAIYILSSIFSLVCVVMLGFVQYYHWRGSGANYQRINSD
ncbi:proton-coupled folate transporter isoform X1 [Pieris rapae]|uniref:proton-coupled folate transporter isoform X1 n=1 Tax=Pieris rapae TaxID=64459 RepID=UPI001E27F6A7|nr:proton-coupled folate transporter isoform X1 [Pieris rapae]